MDKLVVIPVYGLAPENKLFWVGSTQVRAADYPGARPCEDSDFPTQVFEEDDLYQQGRRRP